MKTEVLHPSVAHPDHSRPRRNSIRTGLRSARLLLERAVHRPRHTPKHLRHETVRATAAPVIKAVAAVRYPERQASQHKAKASELVAQRATAETLRGNDMTPTIYKPLLSRDEVVQEMGVNFGALQAIIHTEASPEPLLYFDNSTYDDKGYKTPRFHIMTPSQMRALRQLHAGGDEKGFHKTWEQVIDLHSSGRRRVVSSRHRMPGKGITEGKIHRDEAGIIKPELRGGVEFLFVRVPGGGVSGNLHIYDLDSAHGTVVQYNREPMPAQDGWPNAVLAPPQYNR